MVYFPKFIYYVRLFFFWCWACKSNLVVNQYLRHNLGYKQKIQAIRRNQVYFSSSNVSTNTTVIAKD